MQIATYKSTELANDFMDTVDVSEVQFLEGNIVVYYEPRLDPAEARAKRIVEQRRKAEVQLELQKMDIDLLEHMLKTHQLEGNEDKVAEAEKQLAQTKASIKAWEAQLAVVEKWEA